MRCLFSSLFAALVAATWAREGSDFCMWQCPNANIIFPNACDDKCPPPATGCTFLTSHKFSSETICEAFRKTKPICYGGGCPGAADFDMIAQMDQQFSKAYNARNFSDLASMYVADAVLVPSTADAFVSQKGVTGFFKDQFIKEGTKDLYLMPWKLLRTADGKTIHVIGHASASTMKKTPYYVRWVRDGGEWKINTHVTNVGSPSKYTSVVSAASAVSGPTNITDIILKRDQLFSITYNSQNFAALVDLYAPDAVLIPATLDKYITQDAVGAFWHIVYRKGMKAIKLKPIHLQESADGRVIHEIGSVASTVAGKVQDSVYYVRWLNYGGQWKLETDILAVGTPKDGLGEVVV